MVPTESGVAMAFALTSRRALGIAANYLIEIERGITPASGQSIRPSELPERFPL
jgi:hypothetical protein